MKKLIPFLFVLSTFAADPNSIPFEQADGTGKFKAKQLPTNSSDFLTQLGLSGGPFLPLTGGTMTGNILMGDDDRIQIGSIAPATTNVKFLSVENITAHAHYAFRDDSVINYSSVGLQGHASFAGSPIITGIQASDHNHTFQDTGTFSGSGGLLRWASLYSDPVISGNMSLVCGVFAGQPDGAGTISDYRGFYVAPQGSRSGTTWGFFSEDTGARIGGQILGVWNQNAPSLFDFTNTTSGAAARSVIRAISNSSTGSFQAFSSTFTPSGVTLPDSVQVTAGSDASGGLVLNTSTTTPIIFGINSIEYARFTSTGGFAIKSGSNLRAGTFTLVAGTVPVANTSVTANSVILLTVKTPGGVRTGVPDCVPNPGVGFTATQVGAATDTSVYNYVIVEVN